MHTLCYYETFLKMWKETEPRGMGNGVVSQNGTPKESALSGTSSSRPVVPAAPRDGNANVTRASMDAVETLARKDIKFSSHILIPNSLELGPIQGADERELGMMLG